MNILSILVGLVSLILAFVGLVPLLGWVNWIVIPLAIFGTALGALSSKTSGRNLNILVIIVGAVRLSLGGGIL